MARLSGFLGFLLVLLAFALGLRLVHQVVPALYPAVLSGPFSLDDLGAVKEYAGFSPLVPYYHPIELGARPVYITVTRRPRGRVTIFWQGERFLYLSERDGGGPTEAPPGAAPLAGRPGSFTWAEGRAQHALLLVGTHWVELRTDLPLRDVERIVASLEPYEKLL